MRCPVAICLRKLEVSDDLENFIRNKTLYPAEFWINEETSFVDDPGATGDDSPIFMEAFFEEFNVDPGDFGCNRYFKGGGIFNLFSAAVRLIFPKTERRCERRSLTVGMFQCALDLGVWDSRGLAHRKSQRRKDAPQTSGSMSASLLC